MHIADHQWQNPDRSTPQCHDTPGSDGGVHPHLTGPDADPFSLTLHQLRTALAFTKGSATNLLQSSGPPSPAEAVQLARTVDEQVNVIHHLVNELTAMVQVTRGTTPTDSASPDPQGLVDKPGAISVDAKDRRLRARILALSRYWEGRRSLQAVLSQVGFANVSTGEPDDAEYLIATEKPALILLETTPALNRETGPMERVLRASTAPLIVIAAGSEQQNWMDQALQMGAADCVAIPFSPTELASRSLAAMRRPPRAVRLDASKRYVLGPLVIDCSAHTVSIGEKPVRLTATEYNLLVELAAAAGRVLTYEQLLNRVWGPLYSTDDRIVHTYVNRLRSKLGDDARKPRYILTERGLGYRMAKPTTGDSAA